MKANFVCPQFTAIPLAQREEQNLIKVSVLRKHRTNHTPHNPQIYADVDNYISDAFSIASFDGDRDYYSLNTVDHDYGDDVFHDEVDEYALLTLSDSPDGQIEDDEDEMQNAYLCELECGYL